MQRLLLLSCITFVVSVISFVGGLQAQSRWFKDVPDDHWGKEAIEYVVDAGLMNGMSYDTFAPDAPLTRAQLAMVLYRQSGASVAENEPVSKPASADDDPILGNSNAPVTLIEFLDYEDPFGKRHFDVTLPLIKKEYIDTGKVKLVVRDFPLPFHSNAFKGAEASECADEQGKFWQMHDHLYAEQSDWIDDSNPTDTLVGYAGLLGLHENHFRTCLENGNMVHEISNDMTDGQISGVIGTPNFWILGPNGQNQFITGAYPYGTFRDAFEKMLD